MHPLGELATALFSQSTIDNLHLIDSASAKSFIQFETIYNKYSQTTNKNAIAKPLPLKERVITVNTRCESRSLRVNPKSGVNTHKTSQVVLYGKHQALFSGFQAPLNCTSVRRIVSEI